MIIVKLIKRLLWDLWLVPVDFLRDLYFKPASSNQAVNDLYERGLHCSTELLRSEELLLLDKVYADLIQTRYVSDEGQSTGRISSSGLVDNRLADIVGPMQKTASDYLGVQKAHLELTYFQESKPVQNINNVPGGEFHIDDSKANIKFFVYLSDVSRENGPFAVVPRTHRWNEPQRILRAFDKAITKRRNSLYHNGDPTILVGKARYICGSRGTTFIVDTTCWHKAEPVTQGSRLVFVASFNR